MNGYTGFKGINGEISVSRCSWIPESSCILKLKLIFDGLKIKKTCEGVTVSRRGARGGEVEVNKLESSGFSMCHMAITVMYNPDYYN